MTDGTDAAPYVATFVIVTLVFTGLILVWALLLYVLMAFARMQFFRKVGVEPWIAWVPYYSTWKHLEVGGQQGWIALLSLVPYGSIVSSVFLAIGMYRTDIAFRKDSSWVVLGIFLPFVWCFLLARPTEVYDPALLAAAGYPPPRAGYGSIPPGAPWPPPPGAQPTPAAA